MSKVTKDASKPRKPRKSRKVAEAPTAPEFTEPPEPAETPKLPYTPKELDQAVTTILQALSEAIRILQLPATPENAPPAFLAALIEQASEPFSVVFAWLASSYGRSVVTLRTARVRVMPPRTLVAQIVLKACAPGGAGGTSVVDVRTEVYAPPLSHVAACDSLVTLQKNHARALLVAEADMHLRRAFSGCVYGEALARAAIGVIAERARKIRNRTEELQRAGV